MNHPLQSQAWGEFRKSNRVKVVRLKEGFQTTFHHIPKLPWSIGYCPKSRVPSKKDLKIIKNEAIKQRAILVKFEPKTRPCNRVTGDRVIWP